LVFLIAAFLAGAFFAFSTAEAAGAGAGVLSREVLSTMLSTKGTTLSGVSESVDGASAVRVSAVIVAAISF